MLNKAGTSSGPCPAAVTKKSTLKRKYIRRLVLATH